MGKGIANAYGVYNLKRCRLCLRQKPKSKLPVCDFCLKLLTTGTTVDGLRAACGKVWEDYEERKVERNESKHGDPCEDRNGS